MATITVRVRTSKRMCRVNVPASGNIGNVKAALASDVGVDPAAMTISLDPAGQQVPQDHDTFGRLGIQCVPSCVGGASWLVPPLTLCACMVHRHGTIVFMETSAAIAPSSTPTRRAAGGASLSASGRFVVQNGRVVPAAQAAQSAARSGAGGGAGAGAGSGSGPASAAVNLGRTAKDLARAGLPSKPATDTTGTRVTDGVVRNCNATHCVMCVCLRACACAYVCVCACVCGGRRGHGMAVHPPAAPDVHELRTAAQGREGTLMQRRGTVAPSSTPPHLTRTHTHTHLCR